LVGNTVLYGATGGSLFVAGQAGERFAVRNSGARAVIEGVGDHGCEYMTGGRAVILGSIGRNFAAGMSGGIAYLWDADGLSRARINPGMVDIEELVEPDDIDELKSLIEAHVEATRSRRAARILAEWDEQVGHFIKVMPRDYKRALAELAVEAATDAVATDSVPAQPAAA
jgi:glutamate synthase (NADPH/NADH) large chain